MGLSQRAGLLLIALRHRPHTAAAAQTVDKYYSEGFYETCVIPGDTLTYPANKLYDDVCGDRSGVLTVPLRVRDEVNRVNSPDILGTM